MSRAIKLKRPATDWLALARDLGREFAAKAAVVDAQDQFVAENFAKLKAAGLISAGVPAELGGGGATVGDLVNILRELAKYCGSTALALSMHSHQVATAAWRWRHQQAPVEPLLRRIAAEDLVLISSGGSDWLASSGEATRVDGGFRIQARKAFASGAPAGDLLMTSAVWQNPDLGPEVLHFAVPLKAEGVRLLDTWRVMGMRGTGSQDIEIRDFFVPDAAISGRRPQGKWHILYHTITMIAFPLIYAVYLGIAEAARDRALLMARRRMTDSGLPYLIGDMERELLTARLAHDHMLGVATSSSPGYETTNAIMMGRALVGGSAIRTVEKAMEVAGGAAFYRDQGLERLYRDVQAARFHPLQDKAQLRFAGRFALGLDIDE
ncbi:MAG: acyl-CoA/acyl-ACP dehydrogenase [Sphingomonadales bacterium]|nr:acyl-CoA/acyl-ACP dehydrogenase [Sphingomonadales bacterium]